MAVALSPIGGAGAQFFDNNGNPLSGGKLYTYEAGTTTPAITYTSLAGTTAHTNPIILDSAGRVPGGEIWLTLPDFYKFVLRTSTEVLLGTWDNIQGYSSGSVAYAATEVQIATANQTLFVLNEMFYNPGTNTLAVYVDGVNQVVNNSYVESTPTSVTFMAGLHVGAVVKFVNVNVASADASAVSYEPGFAGSVATTVEAKLRETVSVKDFGAVGNGVANDSAAFLAAFATGKGIFVPAGTYLINVNLAGNNVFVFGEGAASVLKPFDPVARGIVEVTSPNLATVYENITFRDLSFQADVATLGFFEFAHCLVLRGVKHALVDNCEFIGFRGDGVVVAEAVTSISDARENTNVKITNCFFDGVNKDNRNAISIVGCDGCIIENNFITRTTRSNMPGAIDVEPNAAAHYRSNNIVIRNNVIKDIGGNVGAIAFFLPGVTYTNYPRGFVVEGNFIEDCYTGFYFNYAISGGLDANSPDMSVVFANNTVRNCAFRPFDISNVKGIVVENNLFNVSESSAILGFNTGNTRVTDATLINNRFVTVANAAIGGAGLTIFVAVRLTLDGNLFFDCGGGAVANSFAIAFLTGSSSSVSLVNNRITSPNGKTLTRNIFVSGHTLSPQTNTFTTNELIDGLQNDFDWRKGDVRYFAAPPASGAWEVGQYVYNSAPASGQPQGWVNSVAGTPGTWLAMANLA
jgi:hypothetical protein